MTEIGSVAKKQPQGYPNTLNVVFRTETNFGQNRLQGTQFYSIGLFV